MGLGHVHIPMKRPSSGTYTPPADWINISNVADGEINLLVGDGGSYPAVAFSCDTSSSGTYSIDWGDGTIESGRTSGTVYQHAYSVGTGQPCSRGYTTFKIRIYGCTTTLTTFQVQAHSYSTAQIQQYLRCVVGVTTIVHLNNMFQRSNIICQFLEQVILPATLSSMFAMNNSFQSCSGLKDVVMPTSATGMQQMQATFYGCSSLTSITLPPIMNSCLYMISLFWNCTALTSITMPTSVTALLRISYMFKNCSNLVTLTLPNMLSVDTMIDTFRDCTKLSTINNLINCGATNAVYGVDGSGAFTGAKAMTSITMNANFVLFSANGTAGNLNLLTTLSLPNFITIYYSQLTVDQVIDISYTSLTIASLETFFNTLDLTAFWSQHSGFFNIINITGATGAAYISKTGTWAGFSYSTANTSGVSIGMEIFITPMSGTKSMYEYQFTVSSAGNSGTISSNSQIERGAVLRMYNLAGYSMQLLYDVIPLIISPSTVVHFGTVSGGSAITGMAPGLYDGFVIMNTVASINTNVNITLRRARSARYDGSVATVCFSTLKRSIMHLKGWKVIG